MTANLGTVYPPLPDSRIPRDIYNFWRRVGTLARGRVYNVTLIVPEHPDRPVQWVFTEAGKLENEG
jgi:hypothetical protein